MSVLVARDGGLYCGAGDFTVDPAQPVRRAVITHAHADHAYGGSDEYHCSAEGAELTRLRIGDEGAVIPHAWGERFRLGDAVVSLHPAGHIRGSAQVRVEVDGEVWVVSGDYKRHDDPTCTPFEVVPCDVFVTEATFALPVFRWEHPRSVVEQILDWWASNRAAGRCSMLFCYSLGKAQRLLAELADEAFEPVYLHGALERLTSIYRAQGVVMAPTRGATIDAPPRSFAGQLVLAPPSASRSTWMKRFARAETAFASGWMRIRGIRRGRGWDRGFVLSDHVDWPGIIETVQQTGARRVLVTHGRSDVLVRYLGERGVDAAALETAYGDEDD
ncbi:MAG TPA: ligase-associated DNA damage response exonuclease [Pseudomonadales bacterium]